MKLVSILRHAKSSWKESGMHDHDRPLAPRGLRDIPRVGQLLGGLDPHPDRILCSTAVRARETALGIAAAGGCDAEVRLQRRLYLAPAAVWLEALAEIEEGVGHVLLVGHNPGLAELVERLSGQEAEFPTAALARIELPWGSWTEAPGGAAGRLLGLWRPRELPGPAG